MARLKCFTLEGEAVQVTAYEDHHGAKHYDVSLLPEFNERAMTGDKLVKLSKALYNDVERWGSVLNRCAGKFTNTTMFLFFDEGREEKAEGERDDQPEVGT